MIPSLTPRLGLDLGTWKTALTVGDRIVYNEPTVMIADVKTHRVLYRGHEAAERIGKMAPGSELLRPVVRGAIADFAATRFHLRKIFSLAMRPPRFLRPMVVASVPISLNSVEERALCDAAREAGAGQIYLVPSNLASYVSVSNNINDPRGSLVVDMGAGKTDISVMASNQIIVGRTLPLGGDDLTARVQRVLEMTFGVETGWDEAMRAKIEAGLDTKNEKSFMVKRKYEGGGGSISGFKDVSVPYGALAEFIKEGMEPVIDGIVDVLEETPPELYEDIFYRGLFVTGGVARLHGLEEYMQSSLDMKITLLENPHLSAARGLGKILKEFAQFREFFRHNMAL